MHVAMENQAASKTIQHIDYLPPPGKIPVPARDWMAAPHVAETAKKM
jgi:hypothetical protein